MKFSFSQLSTYRTCPRQYEFASIKKIPRQISAGESFGSSIHNTLSKWGKNEITVDQVEENQLTLFTEDAPSQDQVLDLPYLLALWNQSFIVEGYESKDAADAARKKGETILKLYVEWWKQSTREVIAIEKSFKIDVEGQMIAGRFDRVERTDAGIQVIDYKTSKIRSQEEVDTDLQLSIYALACQEVWGEPCSELVLLFLREDGVTEVITQRSTDQLAEAKKQISALSLGILERMFEPIPSEIVCKHCPYSGICDSAI